MSFVRIEDTIINTDLITNVSIDYMNISSYANLTLACYSIVIHLDDTKKSSVIVKHFVFDKFKEIERKAHFMGSERSEASSYFYNEIIKENESLKKQAEEYLEEVLKIINK